MATIRKTLAEAKAKPFRFTADQRARLDAMSDEEITGAAEDDPDNPPLTDEEIGRALFARDVRSAREALRLTQDGFAAVLGIPVGTLRNWEQGRISPDPALLALFKLVRDDPERAVRVLAAA